MIIIDGVSHKHDSLIDGVSNKQDSLIDGVSHKHASWIDGVSHKHDSWIDGVSHKHDSLDSLSLFFYIGTGGKLHKAVKSFFKQVLIHAVKIKNNIKVVFYHFCHF